MGNIFRMASSLGIIQDIAQFVFKMVLVSAVCIAGNEYSNSLNKEKNKEEE